MTHQEVGMVSKGQVISVVLQWGAHLDRWASKPWAVHEPPFLPSMSAQGSVVWVLLTKGALIASFAGAFVVSPSALAGAVVVSTDVLHCAVSTRPPRFAYTIASRGVALLVKLHLGTGRHMGECHQQGQSW